MMAVLLPETPSALEPKNHQLDEQNKNEYAIKPTGN